MKRSKRYGQQSEKIDKRSAYPLDQALETVLEAATAKFDESIDLIMNLKDINLKDPKQRIDKEIILPNNIITKDRPSISAKQIRW